MERQEAKDIDLHYVIQLRAIELTFILVKCLCTVLCYSISNVMRLHYVFSCFCVFRFNMIYNFLFRLVLVISKVDKGNSHSLLSTITLTYRLPDQFFNEGHGQSDLHRISAVC